MRSDDDFALVEAGIDAFAGPTAAEQTVAPASDPIARGPTKQEGPCRIWSQPDLLEIVPGRRDDDTFRKVGGSY